MADPVVSITNGVPTSGTGTITTLGQTLLDGANATLGITTGAAVTTSAAGTLQQYLRGIVSLLVSGITVASHAVTNAGTFAVQVSNANSNGRATPANSAPVVLNSMTYKSCPASSTTILGTTGATGDYLDGVLIIPGTAAAGIVQLKDGTGTAFNIFVGGGTTALPTLAPFYVPVGAISSGGTGGWQVITNANVTAVAIGNGT